MIGFIVIISIIAVTFGAIIKETERFERDMWNMIKDDRD